MPATVKSLNLFRRGAEGEPFTCDNPSVTSAAKQVLTAAGAQSIDIGIAMLENGCAFTAAYTAGNGKSGDSAELGVYRNNWYMLRTYCDHFSGAGPDEWQSLGKQAHNDVIVATKCQRQLWDTLGADKFCVLQRGGLGNPAAGPEYCNYVFKYNNFCEADGGVHLSDGMAIFYHIA
ncbi:MAG: hypothetical protein Q9222_005848, partial [Ikaeria aurantiellina]